MSRSNFKIEVSGIDMAKKQLTGIQEIECQKLATLTDELYAFARAVATNDFANAEYAGKNDVQVGGFVKHRSKFEHNFTVWARGQSVLFIEFGSGIMFQEHPMASQFDMHHGRYGQGKGANPQGWVYKGEAGTSGIPAFGKSDVFYTYGNPPASAMFHAWMSIPEGLRARARRWSQ